MLRLTTGLRGSLTRFNVASLRQIHTTETELLNIEHKLRGLGGGSVDLHIPSSTSAVSSIATITLNNPSKKNAISGKMMCDFLTVVKELEKWQEGAGVILTGDSVFFCAGADLSIASKLNHASSNDGTATGGDMSTMMHEATKRLRRLPLISVAAIEGGAVGGGAELITSCDHRIMASDAHIQFLHAKMALTPGWGGATRLASIVNRREAIRLLCASEYIDASRAKEIHLVDEVSTPGSAVETAYDLLSTYTKHKVDVTRAMKTVIGFSDGISDEALLLERKIFSEMWGAPDNTNAIKNATSKN